jgi:glycosyltransferase involved in cell wall biosynthesis
LRILFIHEVNYLTKPIFEMHEFPEHLASLGHDIGFVHFPEGFNREELAKVSWRTEIAGRAIPQVRISLFTPHVLNGGMAGRLWQALSAFGMLRRVLRQFKPDVVVSLSVPTTGWQAVWLAKNFGVPLVYRALDISHQIRQGTWRSLVKFAEKYVISNAPAISANNLAMADYVLSRGASASEVHVHYPPMGLSLLSSGDRSIGRTMLGIGRDTKVVLYMGSFFYFSGLIEAIKAFADEKTGTDFQFVILGGGEQEAEIKALVSSLGIENQVLLPGFIGFEELPDYLSAADVLLNPMIPSLVSHSALPNKVIQYLATGLPVVSTRLRGLAATFKDFKSITWAETSGESMEIALRKCQEVIPVFDNSRALDDLFGQSAVLGFEAFLKKTAVKP